ncbi:amino acid ABC transporter permease [Pararhizobium sp. PWRC1-1]|uniref:amino acid ABC transporter permease n=1 Tax=Pararhizobium sp. PWRC1-1 TaxID=2804566 RepID=UPI003CF3DEF1
MSRLKQGGDASLWTNAKARSVFMQACAVIVLMYLLFEMFQNTGSNLARMNQDLGFAFLSKSAGFDIVQALVPYSSGSSYTRALLVGFLNTLLISALCIVAATILGFFIGVMRLSKNRLASGVATLYIEFFRNIPVLLQIFVWYSLVILQILPAPRDALSVFDLAFLSNRGMVMPMPIFGESAIYGLLAFVIAIVGIFALISWANHRQNSTGKPFAKFWGSLALIVLLPICGLAVAGFPVTFDVPVRTAFNFSGGLLIVPELMALFLALSIYYATYIAEAVRAGIQAVSHGQSEAAHALGLTLGQTLRKVVIPQAMRVIVPPLISIYLGITKASSLAVAIGYPDLIAVGGTVLNQTGRAIEIVSIWMIIYLCISLIMSSLMNWFNNRMKLVER